MMKYSNQYPDSISTVPLSPFAEEQWNRIVTYSPMYSDWPDYVLASPKQVHKDSVKRRSLISPMHMKAARLEDKLLINELHSMQKLAVLPTRATITETIPYRELKPINVEYGRRTTSPTDEYQRSPEIFHLTRESTKMPGNYAETTPSHQTYSAKHSPIQSQV